MGQADDGLAGGAAPDPRPGEADLIGRPIAQSLPRSPEQIAGRGRGGRGDDDAHHNHRIPIADSCSHPGSVFVIGSRMAELG